MGLNALLRRPGFVARRHSRTVRSLREAVGEMVVVRREPRLAFRMGETGMNYGYLGERLKLSASENFPILVGDVVEHSKGAYITASTIAYLGGDRESVRFEDAHALMDYATHRLLWSWYRRDRDGMAGTRAD